MLKKEEITLSVKKSFWFVFLIHQKWVFWADFVLDHEDIDVRIPVFVGLRNGPEDCWNVVWNSDEDFDFAVNLIQSMLFFAFNKYTVLWIISEISELETREKSIEDIGMDFLLFDFMQLTLFNHLQTFLKIFNPVQFLIDDQLRDSLHPTFRFFILIFTGWFLQPQPYFFLPYRHEMRIILILQMNMLLKVLNPGHINPILKIAIPLLILNDVVGPDMEALETGLFVLHDHLHHPAEVLLVFWFSDAEAFQGILT